MTKKKQQQREKDIWEEKTFREKALDKNANLLKDESTHTHHILFKGYSRKIRIQYV